MAGIFMRGVAALDAGDPCHGLDDELLAGAEQRQRIVSSPALDKIASTQRVDEVVAGGA